MAMPAMPSRPKVVPARPFGDAEQENDHRRGDPGRRLRTAEAAGHQPTPGQRAEGRADHAGMVIPMPGPCVAGGCLAAGRDEDARVVVSPEPWGPASWPWNVQRPDPLEERALVLVFRAGEVVRDAMVATLTDFRPDADEGEPASTWIGTLGTWNGT